MSLVKAIRRILLVCCHAISWVISLGLILAFLFTYGRYRALGRALDTATHITRLPVHNSSFVIFTPQLTRPFYLRGLLKNWDMGGRQLEVISTPHQPSVYASWYNSKVFSEWVSTTNTKALEIVCDPSCDSPDNYYLLSPYLTSIPYLERGIKHTCTLMVFLGTGLCLLLTGRWE